MLVALLASAAVLAAADPAAAPSAAPTKPAEATKTVDPAVAKGKANADPNKLVCHMETEIGSRFQTKKCMTQGEAAMRKFEDRQDLERAQGDTYRR
jgi:hypothetical protein